MLVNRINGLNFKSDYRKTVPTRPSNNKIDLTDGQDSFQKSIPLCNIFDFRVNKILNSDGTSTYEFTDKNEQKLSICCNKSGAISSITGDNIVSLSDKYLSRSYEYPNGDQKALVNIIPKSDIFSALVFDSRERSCVHYVHSRMYDKTVYFQKNDKFTEIVTMPNGQTTESSYYLSFDEALEILREYINY